MNKTLYVADEDAQIWDQAKRQLAFHHSKSLSSYITEQLRKYLATEHNAPKQIAKAPEFFYIQNKGYIGNSVVWWKKELCGYTAILEDALTVEEKEARKICSGRPGEDIMWPVALIDAISSRYVDIKDLTKAKKK